MSVLAFIKRHLARVMRVREFCHRCGQRVDVVWTAPDALWLDLIGHEGDVRCVRCFDRDATARGLLLRWVPHVEGCRESTTDVLPGGS